MMDHIYIGPAPADEPCAQLGITEGFERLNRYECEEYIAAIRKVYGPEPDGAYLHTKLGHHDFGVYLEVACYFDMNKPEASNYAYKVERGLGTWAEADMVAPIHYDKNHQSTSSIEA